MEFETIETTRLILRKMTPNVYKFIYENYTNSQCIHFLGLHSEEELAVEKENFKNGLSSYDKTFLYFQLIEKTSMKVIGMCGFVRHYPAHFRAEFGYALNKDEFKNKGYMSEVGAIIIDYGFQKMNLNRIEAMVGSENTPSLKIIGKLGFTKEGVMKQHYLRNNIFEDSVIFSLLQKDWNN